ncbi:MAG: all-trans-retinol 13,14-reductase [Acidobacteriota bacterium]|jgi:phytoene dehydrogenase-like protein|nr:all-trans-retinol 13,14-reductase [Acidobacteriota bacterium]
MIRPFKGLKGPPRNSYDAVIVGAGIGGLVCANLLAREGLRVLLIEQHYMVGGYCSTFRRRGYTFDAATHFYPLLGNPATITGKLLLELGCLNGWIKMDPVDKFHFPDGASFSVPADFDSYLTRLKAEFQDERKALDPFFDVVREAYLLGLLYYFRGSNTDRLNPFREMTVRDALDKFFRNRKLKLLLAADCGHWGSPPSRTSFIFDSMLRLSYFLGNYYPRGGSQAFADELAARFEQSGGHILMRSLVSRILTRDSEAFGVEVTTNGQGAARTDSVRAGAVISNADMLQTLEKMLPREERVEDYLKQLRELRPTHSCFLTHIGLKNMPTEVLREMEGYHWSSWDAETVTQSAFKIFVPTLFEPRMAPEGGHIVIVQKLIDIDYNAIDDWPQHKAHVEKYIMDNLERVMPGFSEKIVVKMSASAQTSHKYTLNHQGAMLGWEMSPAQLGDARPGLVGPVKNLYFVGHWTQPGGGITPVIVSAMRVAAIITGGSVLRSSTRAQTGEGNTQDTAVFSMSAEAL